MTEKKKKGGFLKGLGVGLIVASAPFFVKALSAKEEIDKIRAINPARADLRQERADFSLTLAIILLVMGIVFLIIRACTSSSNSTPQNSGVPETPKALEAPKPVPEVQKAIPEVKSNDDTLIETVKETARNPFNGVILKTIKSPDEIEEPKLESKPEPKLEPEPKSEPLHEPGEPPVIKKVIAKPEEPKPADQEPDAEASQRSNVRSVVKTFLIVLAVILALVGWFKYLNANHRFNSMVDRYDELMHDHYLIQNEVDTLENQLWQYQSEKNDVESDLYDLRQQMDSFVEKVPFVIDDFTLGKSDGEKVKYYSSRFVTIEDQMWIRPRISYTCFDAGKRTLTIKFHYITSDGDLISSGYDISVNLNEGEGEVDLKDYGGGTKYFWKKGNYLVEIGYDDVCIKSKLYSFY